MAELLCNVVLQNGMMRLAWRGAEDAIRLERYVSRVVLERFPQVVQVTHAADDEHVVSLPVFGVVWVKLGGWREAFAVHQMYGSGMRDCIRLGVEAWSHARRLPAYAFVRKLPRGVEFGDAVHGVGLFEAEWMFDRAVLICN